MNSKPQNNFPPGRFPCREFPTPKPKAMARVSREDYQLKNRLLNHDETARSEVFLQHYEPLTNLMVHRFRSLDQDIIADVVFDALTALVAVPSKFDPLRSSMRTFLALVVHRDLINLLRKPFFKQELHRLDVDDPFRPVSLQELSNPEDEYILGESMDLFHQKLTTIFPDQKDRQMADMVLAGIRKTSAYANVLGVEHFTHSEQKNIVKREKDRIKVKMKRFGFMEFVHKHLNHG